ncbi:MAG TPA: HAMP domain-containing sensor histidine kinase [Blastocatellia bacterium]|nr:HAMP domain-containing sensor histidine kinase [Blastocatellia bacterium]
MQQETVSAFAICAPDGRFIAGDDHFARLFGGSEKLSPEIWQERLNELQLSKLLSDFTATESARQVELQFDGKPFRACVRRLDGNPGRPVFLIEVAIPGAAGEGEGLVGDTGQAALGLTGRLMHDYKNQISGLKLYASWLRKQMAAQPQNDGVSPDAARVTEKILAGLNLLAEHASFVSRLTLPLRLKPAPASLEVLITQAADELRTQAAERGVEIIVAAPADLPHLDCDAHLLFTAFQSLLARAVRACREGGQVRIALEHSRDELRIEIADDGGEVVTEAQCAACFDLPAGERLDTVVLGLALAKKIIAQHGGVVEARPSSPAGAVVGVRLKVR